MCRIKAGRRQGVGEVLALKVDRGEDERGRRFDRRLREPPVLPRLGGGMIDLEYPHTLAQAVTVGEGVESGAEYDDLTDAAGFDRLVKRFLREHRAAGDEELDALAAATA